MTTYLILQKADRAGCRRVLAHIRQLGLIRRDLLKQLRHLDALKARGASHLRKRELEELLAGLVLEPRLGLFDEIYLHRHFGERSWRPGWGWLETAMEVIQ